MFVDFVLNGRGSGEVGELLTHARFDPGMLRPYYDDRGRRCVTINTGRMRTDAKGNPEPIYQKVLISDLQARGIHMPVWNAQTLTKEAWIEIDRTVVMATRQRLRAFADLQAAASRGGFNAMAKMTLEYQAMNDPGEAVVDMDGLSEGRRDTPLFNLKSTPLPITHMDFDFSSRLIAASRNSGVPLDMTGIDLAARRCAEKVEKTLIGTETGMTFGTVSTGPTAHTGNSAVYGYTNFPYRVTKTDLTTPTGTNPEAINTDVLEMIETMQTNGFYGPYMLYHSTPYSRYLNDDYFRTGSTSAVRSVRQRILENEGISDIRRLDYLTSGYQLLLIQMTRDVAEAINGMEFTAVQWESKGGMQQNFKVLGIKTALLKSPYNGVSGIQHGTTS